MGMDPRPTAPRVSATARDLSSIFAPRSVAVIGASRDSGKVGHAIFRNVLEDFQGVVYPVNPSAPAIRGVRSYPSVLEIPDPLDLAIIIVPAASVRAVLDECGRKGVRGVVVISAGFRESGPQGRHRESEVVAAVQQYGFALVGPNCLGVLNTDPAVRLNATFARAMPAAGSIAFLSQSGAPTPAGVGFARARGVRGFQILLPGHKARRAGGSPSSPMPADRGLWRPMRPCARAWNWPLLPRAHSRRCGWRCPLRPRSTIRST